MNISMNTININTPQIYGINQFNQFKKLLSTNNKEGIQKHLLTYKIPQLELNQGLFICIDSFKIQEQTDQCLHLLLRNKANPNCQINGKTPIISAIKTGQSSLVKVLIDFGAKLDQCNKLGQHPLQYLLKSNRQNPDVANYIISNMNTLNIMINNTYPIILTIKNQFLDIFKILLDKGAIINFRNQNILHIIMKHKFNNLQKKKQMLKQLSNKSNLCFYKDQSDKLPIQYQTNQVIKQYYLQLFKPKIKIPQVNKKQNHNNNNNDCNNNLLNKQNKKKKQDDTLFQDIQDQLDQDHIEDDQDKKIDQAGQQQQEQKKNQDQKDKKRNKNISNLRRTPKPFPKIIVDSNPKIKKYQNKKKNPINGVKKKSINSKKIDQNDQQKKQDQDNKKIDKKYDKNQKNQKSQKSIKIQKQQQKIIIRKNINQINDNNNNQLLHKQQKFIIKCQQKNIQNQILTNNQSIIKDLQCLKQQFQLIQKQIQDQQQSQSSQQDQQENKTLTQQITQQILSLIQRIDEVTTKNIIKIQQIIRFIHNIINKCINSQNNKQKQIYNIDIILYGSQANRLAVQHSDIDLLVVSAIPALQLLHKLQLQSAFEYQNIHSLKFITNTAMPVIKMTLDQYKIDLTFQTRGHTGLRCSQLIRQFLIAQPLLRPLVLTLKTLLNSYSLCDTYTGGLGSYSLTLMTIALLQSTQSIKSIENLGKLFLEFLLFYGYQMDYVCEAIIIHPPGFAQKPVYSIYQLPYTIDLNPKLIIYDPLNPVNNVGRATYQILSLKKIFTVWYNRLHLCQCNLKDLMDGSFEQLLHEYI